MFLNSFFNDRFYLMQFIIYEKVIYIYFIHPIHLFILFINNLDFIIYYHSICLYFHYVLHISNYSTHSHSPALPQSHATPILLDLLY
jgi:hypothetical protein